MNTPLLNSFEGPFDPNETPITLNSVAKSLEEILREGNLQEFQLLNLTTNIFKAFNDKIQNNNRSNLNGGFTNNKIWKKYHCQLIILP